MSGYLDNLMMEAYNDVLFMLDWNGDACAGFFYAKSTWLSKLIFSPRSVENLKDFDQTLINAKLNWI